MDSPDYSHLDFSKVPRIAGVPRFLYPTLLTRVRDLVKAMLAAIPPLPSSTRSVVVLLRGARQTTLDRS